MKKLLFSLSILLWASQIYAQESDTIANTSLFRSIVGQYYFEAGMHIGQIFTKKVGMTTHFSGHVVLYKKYHLGIQYERLTNFDKVSLFNSDSLIKAEYIFMNQSAGIRFGYTIFHNKKYQLQPTLAVNWAMIKYRTNDFNIRKWNYFLMEPSVNFSYILHKNVAVGAGINYHINIGLNHALTNKDLNGFYGNLFLRFGLLQ